MMGKQFKIDATTGNWLSKDALTLEESCVIAASVLPGKTPEDIRAFYFDIEEDED